MLYTELYENDLKDCIESVNNINKLKGKKILLTGATGMIGSAIVDLILTYNSQNNEKISLYLADRNKNKVIERFNKYLNGIDYNILEYDACKDITFDVDVDYIIHAAGNCSPSLYVSEPVETMMGNFMGINNLMKYGTSHNTSRVLYISSSEVYGKLNHNLPLVEDDYGYVDLLDLRSSYPSAKRASETLCIGYANEYNIEALIVRPGHIYGPTTSIMDKRAASEFARLAITGNDILLKSSGNQLRSYCYSLDCASAILTVLINGRNCNAYNISNMDSICSIRDLAERFAKICNQKVIFSNPSDAEKKAFNQMENASLDAKKLYELGWKPIFDIKKGTEHYINILKENYNEINS